MYLAPEPTREGELPEHWLWYQVLMGVCKAEATLAVKMAISLWVHE